MKISTLQAASIDSRIVKQVRAHPGISRSLLARKLQIAPSTVSNYTERLIIEGFLTESEKQARQTGRPPTALRLNPEGGQFIGVDFEARNIMAMAVDFSDTPLRQVHKDIEQADSVPQIIQKIEQAISEVLPDIPEKLLGIGIGVPGLVDPAAGLGLHYRYINEWRNVPLVAPLAKRFGVPVYLENNARSMALAELWFGQGRGFKNWLCISIRSGIGAGIIAGGELQRGANHRAGEIGRWRCPESSRRAAGFVTDPDSPGLSGKELQEVASVRAVLRAVERARVVGERSLLFSRPGPVTLADVMHAARQRDRLTLQIIEVAAEILGSAVAELVFTLNPSQVILAGPVTLLGDILLRPLRERAQEILEASGGDVPEIVNSTMGEYSGALGAAALAVQEWKPAR